jgi:hypothetical protein
MTNFARFTLALSVLSCAIGAEESTQPIPATDLAAQFIVGGFPGPPDGEINLARFREMAEANIDVIVPFWGTMDGSSNPQMMDLAHAAGLRVLAMDKRIGPQTMSPDAPFDPAAIRAIVSDYKNHKALFGYGVRDEPPVGMLPRVAEISRLIRRLDAAHPPLIDLFPGYAKPEQLGVPDYREYVHRCIREAEPPVLMYNHYPLKVDRAIDTGWHRDLSIFREESRKAGIPFWLFAQCQGIRGMLRVPTREEIFWQAGTSLAYGTRGVWWYRYWTQPPAEGEDPAIVRHPGSMIDRNGKRSPSYYHVQAANRFLRKAGSALIGWDNRHVARFKDGKLLGGECPAVKPAGAGFDLVVGTFVRGAARRLVIANDRCDHRATIQLIVREGLKSGKIIASLEAEAPVDPADATAGWTMSPGGCIVLELIPSSVPVVSP